MAPARPLRELFTDLVGDPQARTHDSADLLHQHGHADLPAELIAEAITSFAETAAPQVAEHLAPLVMAHTSLLPTDPSELDTDPSGWLRLLATAAPEPPGEMAEDPAASLDATSSADAELDPGDSAGQPGIGGDAAHGAAGSGGVGADLFGHGTAEDLDFGVSADEASWLADMSSGLETGPAIGGEPDLDHFEPAEPGLTEPTGWDEIGLDGVGLDGVGLDGVGLDGVGLDGVGLDGVGHDEAGPDEADTHGEADGGFSDGPLPV